MLSQEQVLRNPPDRFTEGPIERVRHNRIDEVDGERFCGTIETHCVNALQTLRLVLPDGARPRVGYDYSYRIEDAQKPGTVTQSILYILAATVAGTTLVEVAHNPGEFRRATAILRAKCALQLQLAGEGKVRQ